MLVRGFVGSVLVLVGGLVVSTLPQSTAILRHEWLPDLRATEVGRMAALSLVMVGLGLVAAQWLALCRQVGMAEGDEREDALPLVRHATLVWGAPLVLAPPLFSRDGWSYAAQGMLAHLGMSPYEHGPSALRGPVVEAVDPRWMDTVAPYGPLPVTLGQLIASVTGNPWVLVIGHRLIALVGLLLLAWAVPRLARWSNINPALASAVVLASPLMLTSGVGGLHNDLLMVGLMAAALVVAVEHGWAWGAVLGAAAAAVKIPGGLVCIGVVLVSLPIADGLVDRIRRLAAVAAISAGTLVGLGVVTGLGLGWVGALGVPGTVNTPLSITTLVGGAVDWSLATVGLDLDAGAALSVVRNLGTALMLATAAWVALRSPTGDRARAVQGVAVVMTATVVLSPVVHLWYLLWMTPFLATVRLPRLGLAALLAGSLVLGLAAPLDSSLHGAYLAIALGSMLMAVLVPLLLLTRPARERIERITSTHWLPV
ncbi:MAG: polyprenol phosphomannose-dependent alpha 1,6 mannosyltransferase MptB [Nocardioides sp.]